MTTSASTSTASTSARSSRSASRRHAAAPRSSGKDAALELLQRGVADLMTSDGWRRALEFRRRFHTYSFFNMALILSQRPDAQLVAGYRTWQRVGRQVRKGEKGLGILAPMLKRDPDDPTEKVLTGFRLVKVFDIAQTDGEPVPVPEAPRLLEDDPEDLERLAGMEERLVEHCTSLGVALQFDLAPESRALGFYRPGKPEIVIRSDLGPVQRFKVLVHEAAHWQLHTGATDRSTAELEAESAAFLVAHALGVDTSSYSFAYLAGWAPSLDALMQAGERASKAADAILGILDARPESVRLGEGAAM